MKKAFTIIELMVIMTLISVLSAILILSGQSEEKRLAVQRNALKLVQDIREVEEKAMSAEAFNCGGTKIYSYGIFVAAPGDSVAVFADCNGNKTKDIADAIIKEIKTEKGVVVYQTAPSVLNIVFVPPEPATFINGFSSGQEAVITLSSESNPAEPANWKKVKVNNAGRIEIE